MHKKKVLIISHSVIEIDLRILKHKHFFEKNGYKVDTLGAKEQRKNRHTFLFSIKYFFFVLFNKEKANIMLHGNLKIPNGKYDVVFSNDWSSLPLSHKAAKESNSLFVYDSHEMATRQRENSLKWKLFLLPIVRYIEKKYIKYADIVLTVEQNIAMAIKRLYSLKKVLVVRNLPLSLPELAQQKKTVSYPVRLYHHGRYLEGRNIEEIINAVIHLSGTYELHLRLMGNIDK